METLNIIQEGRYTPARRNEAALLNYTALLATLVMEGRKPA